MVPLSYNIRSLWMRRSTTFAVALGIALVVFVLSNVLVLQRAIRATFVGTGRADVAIVLRAGSDSELSSFFFHDATFGAIRSARGVALDATGAPIASGEVLVVLPMARGPALPDANLRLRGLMDGGLALHPGVHIIAGRAPSFSVDEAMVGAALSARFEQLRVGSHIDVGTGRPVRIVATFADQNSSSESEIFAGIDLVREAFGRPGALSSARVRLSSPSSLDTFRASLSETRGLAMGAGLRVERETDYYESQAASLTRFVATMGSLIGGFFAIAAILGTMTTMLASVDKRRRELAILRAIGFTQRSVAFSLFLECVLLATVAGSLGAVAAQLSSARSLDIADVSSGLDTVFALSPDLSTLGAAVAVAVALGALSGIAPALRASRIELSQAMRA